jgi:hypothetical protein
MRPSFRPLRPTELVFGRNGEETLSNSLFFGLYVIPAKLFLVVAAMGVQPSSIAANCSGAAARALVVPAWAP